MKWLIAAVIALMLWSSSPALAARQAAAVAETTAEAAEATAEAAEPPARAGLCTATLGRLPVTPFCYRR